MYDETTNKASYKELQIQVRYWSKSKQQVVSHHLETSFLSYATAEDIIEKLNLAVANYSLPKENIIMLGSDGPNVNKKIHNLFDVDMLKIRGKKLLNIGTCNIHVLHNSFLKGKILYVGGIGIFVNALLLFLGLEEFGYNCSELLVALKHFFKDRPSRWTEFEKIQKKHNLPPHSFIKHVPSRWLTIQPAAERLIEQWPAVLEYFLKFIPNNCKSISKTPKYKLIRDILKKPSIKVETYFVIYSAKMFTRFTGTFQKDEPLIHLLYGELKNLTEQLAVKFLKKETVYELFKCNKNDIESLFTADKMLPLTEVDLGVETKQELKLLPNGDQLVFLHSIRSHYIAALKHILKTLPITGRKPLLEVFGCLHPNRFKKVSVDDFLSLLNSVPIQHHPDMYADEFKLLQADRDTALPCYDLNDRVDSYWNKVFISLKRENGEQKYTFLPSLFKALLTVSHGNSDVERGFSKSGKVLTADRAQMDENTLNCMLLVSSAIKILYSNDLKNVVIGKEILRLASLAYRAYESFLEQKKNEEKQKAIQDEKDKEDKIKELLIQKKAVEEERALKQMEMQAKKATEEEKSKEELCSRLLEEANKRLEKALKHKDLVEVNLAKTMFESARQMREEELRFKSNNEKLLIKINKRKSALLDSFITKKPKPNK